MPMPRSRKQRVRGLDTETTGVDFKHGAKPFYVTMSDEEGNQIYWEWDVDPLTRQPTISKSDLAEIQEEITSADLLILQNPKFDYRSLLTVMPNLKWDWKKVRDTLLSGHLLASNQPHDLTSMAIIYLSINILSYENNLKEIVNAARRLAKAKFPDWSLAKVDHPQMPSAKGSPWKLDMWLPRALRKVGIGEPSWDTVLKEYSNPDSAVVVPLYYEHKRQLEKRGLWKIYEERLKVLPIAASMEEKGITISKERTYELLDRFGEEAQENEAVCKGIAKHLYEYDLVLPKSGKNKSLSEFVFNKLELPIVSRSDKTGEPSMDKNVIEHYQSILPEKSIKRTFVDNLRDKRRRDTCISYLGGYQRFWRPFEGEALWGLLFPNLNPTGTDTLRWSSANPNEQNISKQEGFNLRYAFGPAPGREWWSLDAKNLELRLPAYIAGETDMIELFERPDDPPYYGSNHLLAFATLHPDMFAKYGKDVKKIYASTWYQWTKNGNFAIQYGAIPQSGTADRAFHVEGAQLKLQGRFQQIAKLNKECIEFARKYGYVETVPDKTVDPNHGYPLLCTRNHRGSILETVPLSYKIQGTAMWWTMKAMIRCFSFLQEYNRDKKPEYHARMILQVHDELVFDFPKSKVDPRTVTSFKKDKFNYLRTNIPTIRTIAKLMAQGGDDLNIPTPTSCEYHPVSWDEGFSINLGL